MVTKKGLGTLPSFCALSLSMQADYPYEAGQDGKATECTADEYAPASKIQNYLMVSHHHQSPYTQTSKPRHVCKW